MQALTVFSEEPARTPGKEKSSSLLQEAGGKLVTPRGDVYPGLSEEKLYDIFQEQDLILTPQAILSKEWLFFRDFTSKNKNDTVTFYIDAGKITGWNIGYSPTPGNKGSKYEYNNELIDVWFFPKGKAKWDGSKVSLLDWNKLTRVQKVMFILEYLKQMNGKYKSGITVDVDKYILGMNYYNDNCTEICRDMAAGDAINNLLISDSKASEAPSTGK